MKGRLAALACFATIAFGQRADSPPAAAALNSQVTDAVALDASGRPVTDLTAKDFEAVRGGVAQKITRFTWFDTRLHTAVSRADGTEQVPALDLLPDEIRRDLVVVVDDLGLSPAGIQAVRTLLKAFVAGPMGRGDQVAILCSSGGTGMLQQMTGDTRTLTNAIEGIRYLGGGTTAASAAQAYWLTLGYAMEGVRHLPGRKAIVLFSEHPGEPGPWDLAKNEAARSAHLAGAAVYPVNPLAAANDGDAATGALASLARDTGGSFSSDFAGVLRNEQGYYAIGFEPVAPSGDATAAGASTGPAVLKVRRPGVVLRSRAGFLSPRPRFDDALPPEHTALVLQALASPFAASDIRTRVTARYSEERPGIPAVDAILYFDARDVTVIHDLQDTYRGEVQLRVAAYGDDGRATVPLASTNTFTLRPADYRYALENGVRITFQIRLPRPGGWQIRVVVADGASDRMGRATQFLEIPNLKQGGLALSGVTLGGTSNPPVSREDPGMRIFKPGGTYTFDCTVFGGLTGADKHSSVEVQTSMFADGRLVFEGQPRRVDFGMLTAASQRRIHGQFKLEPLLAPGDYVLKVTVRDLVAPAGEPRTATQFADFEVRE
jgi:VWFA-related protein